MTKTTAKTDTATTPFEVDPAILARAPKTIRTADDADATFSVMASLLAAQRKREASLAEHVNKAKDKLNPEILAFANAYDELEAKLLKFAEKQRDKTTGKTIFGDKKSWVGSYGEIKLSARQPVVGVKDGITEADVLKALKRRKLYQCITVPKMPAIKLNAAECRKLSAEKREELGIILTDQPDNIRAIPKVEAIDAATPATLA